MERLIDRILFQEIIVRKITFRVLDIVFLSCLLVLSLGIRLVLFPVQSGDYVGFLEPWMEQIGQLGGIRSLGYEISNYSSAYMIIMSLLSYCKASPLYLLKAVSVLFDYAAAAAVFLIVLRITGSVRRAIYGMGGLLLAPTVLLNGAYWCQCDIIYTSFLLFAVYELCRDNGERALLLTALGFAFKLQALFAVPFLVIMWLGKKGVCLRDFLLLPIPYILFTLPGVILGRDLWGSLGVYFSQADYYPWLTLNYPNVYTFLDQVYLSEHIIPQLGQAGILVTILLLGFLAFYIYGKKVIINNQLMITIALFSVAITVYFLPHMHERYGMLADVLAVVYGVLAPRKLPIAMGFIFCSLISYTPFLFGKEVSFGHVALLQLVLIVLVGRDLIRQTNAAQPITIKPESSF